MYGEFTLLLKILFYFILLFFNFFCDRELSEGRVSPAYVMVDLGLLSLTIVHAVW